MHLSRCKMKSRKMRSQSSCSVPISSRPSSHFRRVILKRIRIRIRMEKRIEIELKGVWKMIKRRRRWLGLVLIWCSGRRRSCHRVENVKIIIESRWGNGGQIQLMAWGWFTAKTWRWREKSKRKEMRGKDQILSRRDQTWDRDRLEVVKDRGGRDIQWEDAGLGWATFWSQTQIRTTFNQKMNSMTYSKGFD